jgi:hypothetical protein
MADRIAHPLQLASVEGGDALLFPLVIRERGEHLDHRLAEPCDETLVMTRRWAEDHGVPWSRLETGLHDSGAGCDCEVLANVDPDENL